MTSLFKSNHSENAELLFQSIFERANLGIAIFSLKPLVKLIKLNKKCCNILGYTEDELMQIDFRKIIHENIPYKDLKLEIKLLDNEISEYCMEKRCYHKQGFIVWVSLQVIAIKESFEGQKLVLVMVEDITNKKITEENLRLSQTSIENSLEAIFWVNKDSTIYNFNESGRAIIGCSAKELQNRSITEIDPSYSKERWPIFWETLKSKKSMTMTSQLNVKNKIIDIEIDATYVNLNGREMACAFVRNITDRKKWEQKLINSELKFRNLIDDLKVGVILQNADSEILLSNEAANKIFGICITEVKMDDHENLPFNLVNENINKIHFTELPGYSTCTNLEPIKGLIIGVTKKESTSITWLRCDSYPIFDSNKSLIHSITTLTDISDERNYELSLKNIIQEKESLIKEIHHRVKNNLQLVSSILYLRVNKDNNGNLEEILDDVRLKIRSIALIHERLLQTKSVKKVEISDYIKQLVNELEKSIIPPNLSLQIKTNIESALFEVDTAVSCGLIINELILNSIKHAFTEKRNGAITIDLIKIKDKHRLVVSDNGKSIPVHIAPGKHNSFGMELLNIFINQLKGELGITRNQGTSFIIYF